MDVVSALYALTVAAGGIIGYLKAGSIPSLVSGIVFGGLAGFGSYQAGTTGNHTVLLGTSLILAGVMGYRFSSSHKFMPAGLVCILSVGILIRSLTKLGA